MLKGVSLHAKAGDVISIIGSSGSGKSTFLRCINLLEQPNAGQILVNGEQLKLSAATHVKCWRGRSPSACSSFSPAASSKCPQHAPAARRGVPWDTLAPKPSLRKVAVYILRHPLKAATLVPFCADACVISMEGGNENAAYRLAAITDQDVLRAIALPRYSQDTLQLSRFAQERGATVLAITDSPASPLAPIARHVLFAPADHPVLTSSNIAVLALIEGLVAGVMARNKEAVKLATELTESVMSYLHVPGGKVARK